MKKIQKSVFTGLVCVLALLVSFSMAKANESLVEGDYYITELLWKGEEGAERKLLNVYFDGAGRCDVEAVIPEGEQDSGDYTVYDDRRIRIDVDDGVQGHGVVSEDGERFV